LKKFFKFGCLGIIGIIVLIVVVAIFASGGDDSQEKNTSKTEETDNNKTKETAKEGVLTEEKFNKIKNGMTYDEVKEIIGSEGTVISESGEKGTDLHTVMYEWETDGLFSAANFMFQGGKLTNKSQMGVSDSSDVTVTLDKFNEISNGMTYEEVVEIIGGEGNLLSETGEKGTDFYTVIYEYKGEGDPGANANFTFQDNKLQNKAQFGLK